MGSISESSNKDDISEIDKLCKALKDRRECANDFDSKKGFLAYQEHVEQCSDVHWPAIRTSLEVVQDDIPQVHEIINEAQHCEAFNVEEIKKCVSGTYKSIIKDVGC